MVAPTGNTPPIAPSVAPPKAAPAAMPPTSGPAAPAAPAAAATGAGDANAVKGAGWEKVGMVRPKEDPWPAYGTLFGNVPFVKDLGDVRLNDMVKAAIGVDPKLNVPPVSTVLQGVKLDPAGVKALQTHLKAAGMDLGPAGVDGKLGPKTYAALTAFLDKANEAKPAPVIVIPEGPYNAPPKPEAAPYDPNLKVDGHGTGLKLPPKPEPKPEPKPYDPNLKVDGHGTGLKLPPKPEPKPEAAPYDPNLKVDGHGTGLKIPPKPKHVTPDGHGMGVDIKVGIEIKAGIEIKTKP